MPFNRKKFYNALMEMSADQAPIGLPPAPIAPSFAKFMAANSFGMTDKTDAAVLAQKNESNREEGALSKTFGWLMAPMDMMENSVMDITNELKKVDSPSDILKVGKEDFGQNIGNTFKNVTSALGHVIQPVAELAAIPGIEVPWEPNALGDYIEKENTQYHGTGPISGKRILEEGWGVPESNGSWRNSILGLGLDIGLDPLTYLTGGVSAITKLDKVINAGKATDALELAGATGKEVAPKISSLKGGSPESFFKPEQPKLAPTPAGRSKFAPIESFKLGDLAKPASVTGMPKPLISREILQKNLALPVDPQSLRQINAARAGEYKLYDKLRPVVYPEKEIKPHPAYTAHESVGADLTENLALDAPRALTREDQVGIFDQVMEINTSVAAKTTAEQKYLMKGVEDSLEAKGFSFPEGKLSQYLHATKDSSVAKLQEFAKGKPLKERPMDLSTEQKLLQANKAQGRKLLEGKLSKKYPGQVTTPHGINSREVSEAIDRVSSGAGDILYRVPRATSPLLKGAAVRVAEKYHGIMGTKTGASGIIRKADLNPANQTNLYNSLFKETAKLIEENPEIRAMFTDKAGKAVLNSESALAWRRKTALSMLKNAEDHLAGKGLKGTYWDGSGLRLSAVVDELGPNVTDELLTKVMQAYKEGNLDKITDPQVRAAITQALARRKLETGTIAKVILDDFVDKSKVLENTVSNQKFLEWKNTVAIKRAKLAGTAAGLTSRELDAVLDLVKNRVNLEGLEGLTPVQVADTLGKRTIDALLAGHIDHKLIKKMNKALAESVGMTPKAMSLDVQARTVFDTMMGRLTTWYGRGNMVGKAQELAHFNENWAKARAEWFNNVLTTHSKEEVLTAWKYAQGEFKGAELARAEYGSVEPMVADKISKLAGQITDYMENILASSRTVNHPDRLKGTIAVRAEIMMEDLNRYLRSGGTTFQFKGERVKTAVSGKPAAQGAGYGDGNWWASWENADATKLGQDPASFMYDLSVAMDKTTAEYNLIDDFVLHNGFAPGESGFDAALHTNGVAHHRVDPNYKFAAEPARQFQRLLKDIEEGSWIPDGPFIKAYSKALRVWKTGVTQYSPAFHIRNGMGDAFLMWAAGHNNPIHFKNASRMIAANRHRYKGAAEADDLGPLSALMSREEYGLVHSKDTDVILSKYGSDITNAELYGEGVQRGLLVDASRANDIFGKPLFSETAGQSSSFLRRRLEKPLGGYAHKTAMGATELREHTIRLAHFSSAVEKGLTPAIAKRLKAINADDKIVNKVAARRKVLEGVYSKASREVNKWHPDGRDLTPWEQKYMRNIIPFYSWQRKSIPLLIEAMVMRPAKLTMYPKVSFALQNAMGIPAPSIADPFPTDQLFPDWLRSEGIGPIGDAQSDNPLAAWWGKLGTNALLPGIPGEVGYTVANPGNPFNDEVSMLGMASSPIESLKTSASMLTPAFNIPKEALSGTTWTGAPIAESEGGAGYGNWASTQVPIVSMLNRVLRIGAPDTPDYVEQSKSKEAFINLLTALGLRGTGQYLKSAQFDAENK